MSTSPLFPDETKLTFDGHIPAVLQSIIELAHDAILVRDPASIIVFWNRGAEELYGWTAQEAIGKVTHNLLQTHFPVSREVLDSLLATGEQWEGELVHTRKDGTRIDISLSISPIKNKEGQITGASKIARDISERKQLQQHLHFLAH